MASSISSATPGSSLAVEIFSVFPWLLVFGTRTVAAQASLSNLPSCGLTCLLEVIPHSGCSLTDTVCQCASTTLQQKVTACLTANCTMQDGLELARFEASECDMPIRSRSTDVTVVMSALYGVTAIFVLFRLLSKLITRTFCVEDYMIICAVVLTAIPFACVLSSEPILVPAHLKTGRIVADFHGGEVAKLGFGSHLWDLQDGALSKILRLLYISENVYIVVLAITKASIVCFYLRIFWAYPPFQVTCHSVLAFIILSNAAITLVTVFSCEPVEFFWNRDIKGGSCLDITALAYANSGLAVVQDLIIILLPIYMLWSLNMSRKKKIFIGIMFAIGGLGLIATIIRLKTLSAFGNLSDPTWSYVPMVYWTTVELAAGIVASCLPAVRILLERFFKAFHLSTNRSEPSSAFQLCQRQIKPPAQEEFMLEVDSASQRRLTRSRDGISTTSLRRGEPFESRPDFDLG